MDLIGAVQAELHEVVLPSKGVLYGDKLPGGKVVVRPFSTVEEEIIAGPGGRGNMMYELISRCIDKPSKGKMVFGDYLIGDVVFLFMMIRVHTYGPEYSFEHPCMHCGKNFAVHVKMPDELGVYVLEDGFEEPFFVDLPVSKQRVGLRLLRVRDEKEIESYVESYQGPSKNPDHTYRLAKHIMSVGDEQIGKDNFRELLGQVRQLHSRDSEKIRNALDENDCGVDVQLKRTCEQCGRVNQVLVGFTPEFFRATPSSLRSRGRAL